MKLPKVLYILGVILFSILPLVIVVQNHLTHEEGGYRIGFISILVGLLLFYLTIYKKWKNKINTYDIQNSHRALVISFRCISSILVVLSLWYVMTLISVNIDDLIYTLLTVSISMILGYVLQLASVILE